MRWGDLSGQLREARSGSEPRQRGAAAALTTDDLRRMARRTLPGPTFDYLEGGAEDELTLRRNREACDRLQLLPKVLSGVEEPDLTTTILGRPSTLPLALSPTGFTRIFHPQGERAVAAAAGAAGIPYSPATLGTVPLEELAAEGRRLWFQLYLWRDRELTRELVTRAKESGYEALVVTVDTPISGARERDVRNGLSMPPRVTARTVAAALRRPRWAAAMARSEPVVFANVADRTPSGTSTMRFVATQFDPTVTWADVGELVELFGGPVLIKGVLTAEDARRCAEIGAAAVIVSNHGGRQLDSVPSTLDVLPRIVDAVGERLEVLVDSGLRRGIDLVKALALGATACMVGRPYLYGLAADGEAGVRRAIAIFREELRRALILIGADSPAALDRSFVALPEARA
jgi:L-lactate dehydrogenase (cytochrome)